MYPRPLTLSLATIALCSLSAVVCAETTIKSPGKPTGATSGKTPAAAPAAAPATPAAKVMNESDLLKTIDNLGSGDPVRKNPSGIEPPAAATPKPKKDDKAAKSDRSKNGETEITADEGSFDQHTHQAIFINNVFVKNPDFTVKCDKLTAFMKHDDTKPGPGGAAGTKGATPASKPATPAPVAAGATPRPTSKGGGNSGGLERAIAEGNVEIVQDKIEADGSVTHNLAHAKRAEYDAATGDVLLLGKPDVQTGINTCVALEESTTITLNRAGQMKTNGKTKTVIKDAAGADNVPNGR